MARINFVDLDVCCVENLLPLTLLSKIQLPEKELYGLFQQEMRWRLIFMPGIKSFIIKAVFCHEKIERAAASLARALSKLTSRTYFVLWPKKPKSPY